MSLYDETSVVTGLMEAEIHCRISLLIYCQLSTLICGIKMSSVLTRLCEPLCQLNSKSCTPKISRYAERMSSDYSPIHYLRSYWARMIMVSCPPESRAAQRQNCEVVESVLVYIECISVSPFFTFFISSTQDSKEEQRDFWSYAS